MCIKVRRKSYKREMVGKQGKSTQLVPEISATFLKTLRRKASHLFFQKALYKIFLENGLNLKVIDPESFQVEGILLHSQTFLKGDLQNVYF